MSGFRADAARLRESIAVAEAGVYSADDAAQVVVELVATINACEAAKVRFAVQAASGGVHRKLGYADASDWLASVSGSTTRDARDALALVSAVETCPRFTGSAWIARRFWLIWAPGLEASLSRRLRSSDA